MRNNAPIADQLEPLQKQQRLPELWPLCVFYSSLGWDLRGGGEGTGVERRDTGSSYTEPSA